MAYISLKGIPRCHSGELYYVFGTLGQLTRPFCDWNDLVLSQVAVDAWSMFARTFDPNPSFAYLAAREYATPLRILDVPLSNSPYLERAQCDLLGYPLTFYG
ncbi:hypothetical protein J3R82DRAFT_3233 [Butyriboletus roseoflavus]|nr:hypothetical protein J3R82DRAFT_3233 [Butyriboletus roseoflavus]